MFWSSVRLHLHHLIHPTERLTRRVSVKADRVAEATKMVLAMLAKEPAGLKTVELFRRSEIEYPEKPFPVPPPPQQRFGKKGVPLEVPTQPPRPGHAIDSVKFLKEVVLPLMESRSLVKKIHTIREATEEELAAAQAKRDRNPNIQRRNNKRLLEGKDVTVNTKTKVDEWKWFLQERKNEDEVDKEHDEEHDDDDDDHAKPNHPLVFPIPEGKIPYMPGPLDHLNARRKAKRMSTAEAAGELIADILAQKDRTDIGPPAKTPTARVLREERRQRQSSINNTFEYTASRLPALPPRDHLDRH